MVGQLLRYNFRLYFCQNRALKDAPLFSYSKTVLLPKTAFPPWISNPDDRRKLDDELARRCASDRLYEWQLSHDSSKPLFVIHDGPPYANGGVHVGHAVNKILKDIVARYRILRGYRVHFRPGWDCHGLPIELRALQQSHDLASTSSEGILKEAGERFNVMEIRGRSEKFAAATIEEQREAFKSWGCLGDWNDPYSTFDKEYEAKQVELFYELYRKGYVYRAFKPVYWSPSSRTALAEAELKYDSQHRSTAVYFRMEIINFPAPFSIKPGRRVWALIWTTTPWTLPLNDAIFYNKSSIYCLVRLGNETYFVAEKALDNLRKTTNGDLEILDRFGDSSFLGDLRYVNPIDEREKRFLAADFVDPAKGTGLTHGAFAHGFEDYVVAEKYGLKVECFVDENGDYDRSKFANSNFAGRNVLDEETHRLILNAYRNNVLAVQEIIHSYPYDWRTNRPLIIRATKQWFVDAEKLKHQAMTILKTESRFFPHWANDRMFQLLKDRPSGWCISRQRCWGVPVPVFYTLDDDEGLVDENAIRHVAALIRNEGAGCWWRYDVDALLGDSPLKKMRLRKGDDIFDIWLDSGISWAAANLPTSSGGKVIADLTLEGEDQFRGWFQSSLLTSVALQSCAPYRRVFVHGFVVDDNGQKMSKSVGNVVEPAKLTAGDATNPKLFPPVGVDGLRLWVGLNANEYPIRLGPQAVGKVEKAIRNVRKILKFILGALSDFDVEKDTLEYEQLQNIDRYILHRLASYITEIETAYEQYDFSLATTSALKFLDGLLANLYITVSKHRLYCAGRTSRERRATQTVLHYASDTFIRTIAPVMPHLCEEFILYRGQTRDENLTGIFRYGWAKGRDEWRDELLAKDFDDALLPARTQFFAQFGNSNTQQFDLEIRLPKRFASAIKRCETSNDDDESELRGFMQTAKVVVVILENDSPDFEFSVTKTSKYLCPRCRRFARLSASDAICKFCTAVIKSTG